MKRSWTRRTGSSVAANGSHPSATRYNSRRENLKTSTSTAWETPSRSAVRPRKDCRPPATDRSRWQLYNCRTHSGVAAGIWGACRLWGLSARRRRWSTAQQSFPLEESLMRHLPGSPRGTRDSRAGPGELPGAPALQRSGGRWRVPGRGRDVRICAGASGNGRPTYRDHTRVFGSSYDTTLPKQQRRELGEIVAPVDPRVAARTLLERRSETVRLEHLQRRLGGGQQEVL